MPQPSLVDIASQLEQRLCDDPIVSEDIKNLARLLHAIAEEIQSLAVSVVALERRPAAEPFDANTEHEKMMIEAQRKMLGLD